jgi:hypothetical protein
MYFDIGDLLEGGPSAAPTACHEGLQVRVTRAEDRPFQPSLVLQDAGTLLRALGIRRHADALVDAAVQACVANLVRLVQLTDGEWIFYSRDNDHYAGLKPPMGGGGGVVEVDETIYGRAATHPQGRGPFGPKLSNSAHKNVVLSLVERDGSVRSHHIEGSTVHQVIPIVRDNICHEAQVMTDKAQLYKYRLGNFASHDRVDHSQKEYARYEDGRPTIHTNTVEGYFSLFKRGMRGTYQHCKEKHLHRYLAEFDFRYNARVRLGIDDQQRAAKALVGLKGKRLTYRTARGARPEAGEVEDAPPF